MTLLLFVLMAATLGVLVAGLYVTYRGGDLSLNYSNKLMRWRIWLQALAILVLGILMLR